MISRSLLLSRAARCQQPTSRLSFAGCHRSIFNSWVVTLCFSPTQALLAAKAGATYISPFLGRLDDLSDEGMSLIEQILGIYANYDFETQVLAASIRHPLHVAQAAQLGADVATIPFAVLAQLYRHPLTDLGLERFLGDWQKTGRSFDEGV